ncbi:MAG: ABC transporter substrate-binding protein [Rhodospirillaceae bacterium]
MHASRLFSRRALGALILSASFAGALSAPTPLHAAPATPASLVEDFHARLVAVMKDAKTLGFQGRYDRLTPAITGTFHLRLMTQITSGAPWRKASETEKKALVAAFSTVSVATYAARFSGFSGQHFETLGVKPGARETQLVMTRLVNPGDENVALTYVTKRVEGAWRVIDVVLASGISELALRKSEYRQILQQGGVPGLTTALNAKAAELEAGTKPNG